MARFAVVNQDGLVISVVIWEGNEWLPPQDHTVILGSMADIGDTYDFVNDVFIKPDRTASDPIVEEVPAPTVESLAAELAALKQQLNIS